MYEFIKEKLYCFIRCVCCGSRWNCQQQIAVHFILIIALCNPAVLLILAERSHFQRRNLKRHIAARLAVEGFGVVYFFA